VKVLNQTSPFKAQKNNHYTLSQLEAIHTASGLVTFHEILPHMWPGIKAKCPILCFLRNGGCHFSFQGTYGSITKEEDEVVSRGYSHNDRSCIPGGSYATKADGNPSNH